MITSIAHAAWFKAQETRALMQALEAVRTGGSRFVGGCVRNMLMGPDEGSLRIPLPLRGGGRGWGETPPLQNQLAPGRGKISNIELHPAPRSPPLKGRGR